MGDKMPSQNLFSREIELCDKNLIIDQQLEGDVFCVVWDAALVLSKYLERLRVENTLNFKNLQVLELGSGVGCVGLTAAVMGSNVILTDLPEAIPILQINIDKNLKTIESAEGNVIAKIFHWGNNIDELNLEYKPDLILIADCIYYSEAVPKLVKTLVDLSNLSHQDTKIFISQEERDSKKQTLIWNEFIQLVQIHFHVREIPYIQHNPDCRSHDIKIIELKPLSL